MSLTNIYFATTNQLINLPAVMGILNLHPHSFSKKNLARDPYHALDIALEMQAAGAAIIDIGAEPTNPHLTQTISHSEELNLLSKAIDLIKQKVKIPLSIDTSDAKVMARMIDAGIDMINDTRALQLPHALTTVAAAKVHVCLMYQHQSKNHINVKPLLQLDRRLDCGIHTNVIMDPAVKPRDDAGTGDNAGTGDDVGTQDNVLIGIQDDTEKDIVQSTVNFLTKRIHACETAGISRDRMIIDPGFGGGQFGKTTAQNLRLLRELSRFQEFNLPILVGVSRKMFIGAVLNLPEEKRLNGSLAAASWAIMQGAHIIRSHDVTETVEVMKMLETIRKESDYIE